MTTITIYGYVFNGKKWKYKQKSYDIPVEYNKAKEYSKMMIERLLKDKTISLEGIAVSKMHDNEVTKEELHKNKVFSERHKGTHKYRTNEESLGSLKTYVIYKSK